MRDGRKTALVTGGAKGIGAAAARLLPAGYAVAVNYKTSEAAARALVQELQAGGGRALAFGADVAQEAEVKALFAAVRTCLGPVDALVCNAGVAERRLFLDLTADSYGRMMDNNLKSAFFVLQRGAGRHAGPGRRGDRSGCRPCGGGGALPARCTTRRARRG